VNDGGGNCIGCFDIMAGTDAEKSTNMGIAAFEQRGYLIREGEVLIEYKTEIAGRVGSFDRKVMELG